VYYIPNLYIQIKKRLGLNMKLKSGQLAVLTIEGVTKASRVNVSCHGFEQMSAN